MTPYCPRRNLFGPYLRGVNRCKKARAVLHVAVNCKRIQLCIEEVRRLSRRGVKLNMNVAICPFRYPQSAPNSVNSSLRGPNGATKDEVFFQPKLILHPSAA